MNRKLIILVVVVVAVVAIVAFVAVPIFLGAINPPVDVYARPTPSASERARDLLPNQVAGFSLLDILGQSFAGGEIAGGLYEGGIEIDIWRFSTSGAAASLIEDQILFFEGRSGSRTSVNVGEQHWLTFTGGGTSVFAWRKGIWVFRVTAPDEGLRNQVVEELPF